MRAFRYTLREILEVVRVSMWDVACDGVEALERLQLCTGAVVW